MRGGDVLKQTRYTQSPGSGTLNYPHNIYIAFNDIWTAEYYNGEHSGEEYLFPRVDSQDISPDKVYL